MSASGRLISNIDHLTVFHNADACGATTNVNNRTVLNTKNTGCSSGFIHHVGDFKTRTFHNIANAANVAVHNSRWNRGSCSVK